MKTNEQLLSGLYHDFCLLESGDWSPDRHSIEASLDAVKLLASRLNLSLRDSEGRIIENEFPQVKDYCDLNPSSPQCKIYDV